MSHTIDPGLASALRARNVDLVAAGADEAADILQRNLSSSSHGTGVKYARLPNRSSAPGEMPVMQSGQLASGVTSVRTEAGAQVVISDDLGKLLGLEFSPPSANPNQPGVPRRVSGGRAPMWETMNNAQTVEAMAERMRQT